MRIHPDVGAIARHVDGRVAENADPASARFAPQGVPLSEEEELEINVWFKPEELVKHKPSYTKFTLKED